MGEWDNVTFAAALDEALSKLDRARVTALCEELVAHLARNGDGYPEKDARKHLVGLRNKRYFELVALVADRMLRGADYWDHASMLELAMCDGDEASIDIHLGKALAALGPEVKEKWMPKTTADNLAGLRRVRARRRVAVAAAARAEVELLRKAGEPESLT